MFFDYPKVGGCYNSYTEFEEDCCLAGVVIPDLFCLASISTTKIRTIYISGPMESVNGLNFEKFNHVARILRKLGYTVHNPAEVEQNHSDGKPKSRGDFMREDFNLVTQSDAIYVLIGSHRSPGVRDEIAAAVSCGVHIIFEPGY